MSDPESETEQDSTRPEDQASTTEAGGRAGDGGAGRRPPDSATLRTLVVHATVIALTPLIPLPFLDDWTRNRLRRKQVAQRAESHGTSLGDDPLELLAAGEGGFEMKGCLKGCALSAMIKPTFYVLKKLSIKVFRKIMIFLMIKDSADQFARTLGEGMLYEHALTTGRLGDSPSIEQARSVRRAADRALKTAGRSPIEQVARATFAGSRGLIRHAAQSIAKRVGKLRRGGADGAALAGELERESESELGSLIDTLTREVSEETAYLEDLVERFEEELGRRA